LFASRYVFVIVPVGKIGKRNCCLDVWFNQCVVSSFLFLIIFEFHMNHSFFHQVPFVPKIKRNKIAYLKNV
jgi:hypothetical protein